MISPRLPTVLVLDGQTLQALACVRSLGRAGYPVVVASHRAWPLAAWSRYCGHRIRLAAETPAGFADLRRRAAGLRVNIVLPLTERACVLCSADAKQWQAAGIVLGCGPANMLARAFDKAKTFERAAACGVPIPTTRCPHSLQGFREAARELGFPCVVKPRFSNAWHESQFLPDVGIAYVDRVEDIEAAVVPRKQGEHWPIIQRYVQGRGKGVFALCDRGRVIQWFAHERLRDVRPSGSGSSLRRSVALDPCLRDRSHRLLSAMEWHGPAMLEFRDDGTNPPWLMEVNGRFWGSLQLAVAAGADFPVQWVRMLHGAPVIPRSRYRRGVVVRWLWGDVKRLLHVVRGPPLGYPGRYPPVWQGLKEILGRQPPGTRVETWDSDDPWPVVAEWLQGLRDLIPALERNDQRLSGKEAT